MRRPPWATTLAILFAWFAFAVSVQTLLGGCDSGGASPGGQTIGERIWKDTEGAWYARDDLPPVGDRGRCENLYMLQVYTPSDEAGYTGYCPRESWACIYWSYLSGHVRSVKYPVAVMSPDLSADKWPAHAVHELLHAVNLCSGLDYYSHADTRVFGYGNGSVEDVVVSGIYEVTQHDIVSTNFEMLCTVTGEMIRGGPLIGRSR